MSEQVLHSDLHLNRAVHAAAAPPRRSWQAGDLVVDLELRKVTRNGERVVLQEMPLRLLCLLLEREGRPLARRELHAQLWPHYDWDSFERNLNTAVRKLRRAIGDDAREPRLIETLRASGYRWIGAPPRALDAVPQTGPVAAPERRATRPDRRRVPLGLAAAGAGAAALVAWLALNGPPAAAPMRWVRVETVPAAAAAAEPARALTDQLQRSLDFAALDAREPVRVAVSVRNGEPVRADIDGRGAHLSLPLGDAAFGRERLLAELAARAPAGAVRAGPATLPAPAERAFADAGTLLVGADSIEPVERAIALLETVLSAAPEHGGALRLYARAQRLHAVLARDPRAARERRLMARDALRRAAAAEPAAAALALDIAVHLFWGEGNSTEAADWFALARREAPQDAEILHSYAWFALADNRIGAALQAIDAALAMAPLSVPLHSDLGWFYFRTGRFDDALRQCRITLEMAADDEPARICEERALLELGRADEAWAALRRHAPKWLDAATAQRLDAAGPARAYRAAMHLAAQDKRRRVGAGFDSACLEAIAGERDAAVADLAVAEALGDPGLRLARVSPELVRLLGAPEATRLARLEALRQSTSASG